MANRNDLNLFIVADHDPNHKTWYYSSEGMAEYDAKSRQITIIADKELSYLV
jgi:hypothetical protein